MKTTKPPSDEMRAEYRREDLGPLVRGKYAARYAKATNIVVIDPALTKAFPNTPDGSLIFVSPNAAGTLGMGNFAPFGVAAPRLNKSPLMQFADTVTVTRAAHNIQFGFELNPR